ncbi:MAG: phosphoethanolamine transferase [Snodgrassella sp.]|uniref:phosphoethanolamine transferase n=1 Tax=Snodgrassella sp. TaxID=2815304 RepID=UPI00258F0D89|nr:phosphoethanolamine transferase [Snodgrassella sp.]MCO6522257.1 phosphoethanolamine transferase [Snodgrassella sp.]
MKLVINIFVILLLLVFCGLSVLGTSSYSVIYQIGLYFATVGYFSLLILLWRSRVTRIFSILLLFLWCFNTGISLIMFQIYHCHFNAELAITMLASNTSEAIEFLYSYWHVVLCLMFMFILLIVLIKTATQILFLPVLKIIAIIFIAAIPLKALEQIVKGRLSQESYDLGEKVWPYTGLNNFAILSRAHKDMNVLKTVAGQQTVYELQRKETDIDTYVVVIGESARRANLSLYGYSRLTTPNIDKERANLFIFKQAVAPAPVTLMVVPNVLSRRTINDKGIDKLNDNVVNLAGQAGFKTYWLSKQGKINKYDTLITAIANAAENKEWLNGGYDDTLLPRFVKILNEDDVEKKLIILHINGSHKNACTKYPESEQVFKNGRSSIEDCYDNSIHFTDKILGEIFNHLRNKKASLLYFSDHGQTIKIKRGQIDYTHAVVHPTKEGLDVPQFIWYSPKVTDNSRKTGEYKEVYPTEDNYYLIHDWMGIEKVNELNTHSVLSTDFIPRKKIQVIDTDLNIFDYQDLPLDEIRPYQN